MKKLSAFQATLILLSVMAVAGCVSADKLGLEVSGATPVSITIWAQNSTPVFGGPRGATDAEVTAVAQEHCQIYGKNARRMLQEFRKHDRIITFDCVK